MPVKLPSAASPSPRAKISVRRVRCPTPASAFITATGASKPSWHTKTTLTLTADDPLDDFIRHAPPGQPYVCLEPISHVADAINLAEQGWEGTGLRVLEPGETLSLRMQLRIHLED